MAKEEDLIENKIQRLHGKIKNQFPVKKILLFGSYAKNEATAESDIDIAVVLEMTDHLKRIEIAAKLSYLAHQIDVNFELKCIFLDEFLKPEKGSILSEIIKTGKEIINT